MCPSVPHGHGLDASHYTVDCVGVRRVAAGVGAAVATPVVYTPLRTVAKQLLKGGLWTVHGAQVVVKTTADGWGALVAEARSELRSETGGPSVQLSGDGQQRFRRRRPSRTTALSTPTAEAPPLTSVKGIGGDYAQLLRAAGVRTVDALSTWNPGRLHAALVEANEQHDFVARVPSADRIRTWIDRAKGRED